MYINSWIIYHVSHHWYGHKGLQVKFWNCEIPSTRGISAHWFQPKNRLHNGLPPAHSWFHWGRFPIIHSNYNYVKICWCLQFNIGKCSWRTRDSRVKSYLANIWCWLDIGPMLPSTTQCQSLTGMKSLLGSFTLTYVIMRTKDLSQGVLICLTPIPHWWQANHLHVWFR